MNKSRNNISVGVIGLGFVGGSMLKSFLLNNANAEGYDKYKDGGIGTFESMLDKDILFLALPTLFDEVRNAYNQDAIYEVCGKLEEEKFSGVIVIKSTLEPESTNKLAAKFSRLTFIHNPEFLTARTAFEDFHSQKHIVLGKGPGTSEKHCEKVTSFYNEYYPDAEISGCSAMESESMKIFCNCFYASKIQIFNEYYLLCQKNGSDYKRITELMLKNGWINPMHTNVPGPDGSLSYGGACFPKDTNALLQYMKNMDTPHKVLENIVKERNEMRPHKKN
tara:strand:- start:40 stop:873 length:834 start_codon:yes stop_codon:yes gene_type:complete